MKKLDHFHKTNTTRNLEKLFYLPKKKYKKCITLICLKS